MEREDLEIKTSFMTISLSSILSFVLYFATSVLFFFFLNKRTGSGFGFVEILFSFTVAIIAAAFLVWLREFIKRRPYLGSIVGLLALFFIEYSMLIRYTGQITIIFAIVIAVITVAFIMLFFFKYKESNHSLIVKEFNDNY